MANNIIVPIPTNLKEIKSELIFGLTKRQVIGFGITGAISIPFFLLTKDINLELAMYGSFIIGVPVIFLTMYTREKLPSEKWLKSILEHKAIFGEKRQYKVTPKNKKVAIQRGFIKNDEEKNAVPKVTTIRRAEAT